jgi:DNA ligase-1
MISYQLVNLAALLRLSIALCFIFSLSSTPINANDDKALEDISSPSFSLANEFSPDIDITAYWVSEKLDGVRAYWNGKQLLTRNHNIINAPPWFTAKFPHHPLDGELWKERGAFQQTVSVVRKKIPIDREWLTISYQVFDLPDSTANFDQRLQQLESIIDNKNPFIQLIEQWRVGSLQQLDAQLMERVSQGAEGLMLRRGSSLHHTQRNNDFIKYKLFADAEATVIAYKKGKGKITGMMGSLLVELDNGLQFYIGTGFTQQQRKSPPPIGSLITFQYSGFTNKGIPRHARFLRIRHDQGL